VLDRLLIGLVVILIGALLLANNTGYLPWSMWYSVTSYWPLLVIGLGLQIALSRWRFPGLALAIIAMLILGAMNPYGGGPGSIRWRYRVPKLPITRPIDTQRKEFKVPLGASVSRITFNVETGSVRVEVRGDSGLNSPEPLATAMELGWDKVEPKTSYFEGGQDITVDVKTPSTPGEDAGRQECEVIVNPSLITRFRVTGGVADLSIDGNLVVLGDLEVSAGVSKVDLTLGLSGKETRVVVSSGVANVSLRVPHSAGVRISVSGPPFVTKADFSRQGLVKKGDVWITPSYSEASTRVDLQVTCGAGKVELERIER